jgi:hypothetical protein
MLNRPVYVNTLRWFLNSTGRVVVAGLIGLVTYGIVAASAENGAVSAAAMADSGNKGLVILAWLLGVGLIRREIKSGSIHLVALRPLSRASYVLSKWAALLTLNLAFLAFVYAVAVLKGGPSALGGGVAWVALAQVMQIGALCAVLTFLSVLPFSVGELGTAFFAVVVLAVLDHVASRQDWPALGSAADWGFRILIPRVALDGAAVPGLLAGPSASVDIGGSLLVNAVILVAALSGAVGLFARREFPYAESAA